MAGRKSGGKAKSAGASRRGKSKAKGALKDLDVKNPRGGAVRGGRKAGKDQHEYLIVKMTDVLIT